MKRNLPASVPVALVALPLLLVLAAGSAQAALNAYAELTVNGDGISGDTTMSTIGGVDVSADHIEAYAVNHEVYTDGRGGATHTPFKLVKRVDKASPRLYQALAQNQVVAGTVKYFAPNPQDGTTELYFTIEIVGGRVSRIRHWSPNNMDPAGGNYPHMEEVSFTYERLIIRSERTSTEFQLENSTRL